MVSALERCGDVGHEVCVLYRLVQEYLDCGLLVLRCVGGVTVPHENCRRIALEVLRLHFNRLPLGVGVGYHGEPSVVFRTKRCEGVRFADNRLSELRVVNV